MGIGAARFHGAIPRTLGSTTVVVPLQGIRPVRLATGTMHLVVREMERLDVTPESTELGTGFVTTPEQTVVDLLQRPGQGDAEEEALRSVPQLYPMVDPEELAALVDDAPRVRRETRRALDQLGGRG